MGDILDLYNEILQLKKVNAYFYEVLVEKGIIEEKQPDKKKLDKVD